MTTLPQDLFEQACAIAQHAYAPYSKFPVACAIRSKGGHIHTGVNVENLAFPIGCCAEQSAVSAMVGAGERDIQEVLILGPGPEICSPCGGCRQILKEFSDDNTRITLATPEGTFTQHSMEELLPGAFSAKLSSERNER